MTAARAAAMLLLLTFLALTFGLEENQNATRGRRQFEFARTELYEEQLLMSELQLDQQQTQQKLQALQMQRQFAVPGSAFAIRLDNQQTELLQRLQEDGLQFQDLQARLQLRVLQQTPSTPFLFRPHNPFNADPPNNEVRRRQSPQQTVNTFSPIVVISGTTDVEEPVSDPQFQQQGFQQQPQPFQRPQGARPTQPQQNFNAPQAPQRPPGQVFQPQQRPQGFGPQQGFQTFQPPQNRPPHQQQQQQQQQGFQQPQQQQGVQQPTFQPQQPQQPFNPPPQNQQGQQPGTCRAFNGQVGTCQPLVRCVTFYVEVTELRKNPCPLGPPGQFGVCCPPRGNEPPPDKGGVSAFGVLRPPSPPRVIVPNLSPAQLNGAGRKGLEALLARLELAAQLFAAGVVVTPGSAAGFHQEFFQTDNDTLKRGEEAQKGVDASVSLVEELQLTPEQGTFALPQFSILDTVIADTCPPEVRCDARRKYRTADGSCNNIADGRWGRAGAAHQRILPPKYGDGVNSPRVGSNGVTLPSARTVSRSLSGEVVDLAEDNLTLLVMQWGQFLDHDLTHTPISKGPSQSGIACCSNGRVSDPSQRHPDCFPIEMPDTDPIFTPLGEHCMEFVRSLPAPRPQCNFGPREQMNQITAYMDASNVYGSSEAHQRELRLFQGGLLRAQQTRRSKMLLPESRSECTDDEDRLACFKAGDGRVNEQVQLTVMHTVWMREHNRIAPMLQRLNPNWSDEAIFQETRRIVNAQMQHITYNEWLPILLGRGPMEKLGLLPREQEGTKHYDPNLNAGVTNVFATAAFRFGHSLIRDSMQGFSQFGTVRENLILHKNQFTPFVLYKDGAIDDFIRGLSTQTSQRFDRFFSREVTDKLFQGDLPFGLDLLALNIQRGRDHGLPPYNDWREVCGMPRVTSWEQLSTQMDPQAIRALQRVYQSVEEVDLFPALVSERSQQEGALLGPTLVCLLSDQFARLRRGDRFFYEEEDQVGSFTPRQLSELKKTSLARVLCDNSDDVIRMQPLVFFKASFANQRVDCTSDAIPRMDLSAWKDEPVPV